MRLRTIYGALMIAGIALLVLADAFLLASRPLGAVLMTLLALAGWLEYARLTGISGKGPKSHAGLHLLGILCVLYFFALAWLSARIELPAGWGAWIAGGILGHILLAFLLVVTRQDFERTYVTLLETILGGLLLGFFLSFYLKIYCLPGWQGPVLWAVFVGGVKGNDTAAYYVGKAWGRHRFLNVSPKKTLEGSLGALAFSALYFTGAAAWIHHRSPESLFPAVGGMLFGMILSIASQAGDLSESLFKRVYRVKDSGALLPEFGGVLDMVDSLLFAGALSWLALGIGQPAEGLFR